VAEPDAAFNIGHKGGKTLTYGYYAKADELQEAAKAVEQAAIIIQRDWL
jgi:hypothetical protein